MQFFKYTSFLLAFPTLLSALPLEDTTALTCPTSGPCIAYNDVLEYCSDLLSAPVYGNGQFAGRAPIDCVCTEEALGYETGWYAATVCYDCGKTKGTGLKLLERWMRVCATRFHLNDASAVECWNSDLEKGCWRA